MVSRLLQRVANWTRERSSSPWASFEVLGFEKDGRIKVTCSWNKAFIKTIHALGFQAETEEDSVQLFFYTAQARPTQLDGVELDAAVSEGHPNLMSDTNSLRTG